MKKTRTCCLIVLSTTIFSSLYSCKLLVPRKGPRKAYARAAACKPFDAIIIPGTPFINGHWDSVMKARVIWSWILYKNGYTSNIIYSGAAVYSPYKEAIIMGLYAQQLGIPAEHIFYDTLARHSTENVFYSYLVARKLGFKTIALATDPFQSWLLKGFLRKRFGSCIYRLPFITDSLAAYSSITPVINPATAKAPKGWISITRKESFFKRFKGTLGRDIKWADYEHRRLPPL
ncbi:YdcF family protein [Chitinophagaceae bacterium MMS25-I14]